MEATDRESDTVGVANGHANGYGVAIHHLEREVAELRGDVKELSAWREVSRRNWYVVILALALTGAVATIFGRAFVNAYVSRVVVAQGQPGGTTAISGHWVGRIEAIRRAAAALPDDPAYRLADGRPRIDALERKLYPWRVEVEERDLAWLLERQAAQ